jgi:predicted nucleic acid-binding Zn ribbon protein
MRRREPKPAGRAIAALAERLAPQTVLADVQRVWPGAVGDVVAAQAQPTGERDGVLVVTCASAVWAQELDLMSPDVIERLNAKLRTGRIQSLRCQATPARGWVE